MGASRRAVATALGVVCATALVQWVGSVPVLGIELLPVVGVTFVASLSLGDRGAYGASVGVLLGGILAGAYDAVTVTVAAAILAYGFAVPRVWSGIATRAGTGDGGLHSREALTVVPVVAVVSAPLAAGAAGSTASILTGVPFFVGATDALVQYAASGVLLGWPLAVGLERFGAHLADSDVDPRTAGDRSTGTRLAVIAVAWIAVGAVLDVGVTIARLVPVSFYRSRFGVEIGPAVLNAIQLAGQVAVLLAVLAVLWRWGLLDRSARRRTDDSTRRRSPPRESAEPATRTRLTRRHALVALAGLGVVAVGTDGLSEPEVGPLTDDERELLHAVTDVLYPSEVTVDDAFLQTYVTGRYRASHADRRHVSEALAFVDTVARNRFGDGFASLPATRRERVLEAIGVDRVGATADGRLPERVRYYLVNDLLFALYATPIGGELVGRDNPTGFPGGLEAYQRGPEA